LIQKPTTFSHYSKGILVKH